jgi:RNA polymerase sigma factor for flagellar operon FliA
MNTGVAMYRQHADAHQLVEQHAPLVKRIALHVLARLPRHVELDDLYQAGMIGLLEAARNFDHTKGASFETYASIRIRGAIIDEIRKGDWAPRSVHRNARAVADTISAIEQETGRDARDDEIAERLGVSLEQYHRMVADINGVRVIGIEDAVSQEENIGAGTKLVDQMDLMHEVSDARFRQALSEAIDKLPEREKLTLSLYYEQELNLKEIGLVLGISESRVCQIHGQAIARLRSRLKDWLD